MVQFETIIIYFLIGAIIFHIYTALVLMELSKKLKRGSPWFAWVPFLNLYLMVEVAALPMWVFFVILFANFVPTIGWILSLPFCICTWWKIAEARKRPGWYGLLMLVPLVNLVIMGIIAWKDE